MNTAANTTKLTLTRETLRTLTSDELRLVAGGRRPPQQSQPPVTIRCTT